MSTQSAVGKMNEIIKNLEILFIFLMANHNRTLVV